MVIKKLDRQETDFMREYIQEGVAKGETIVEIRERRKELAALFGCTLPQVSGAVAWKSENGNLELKPLELGNNGNGENYHAKSTEINGITNSNEETKEETAEPKMEIQLPTPDDASKTPDNIRIHPKSGAWTDYENSEIKEVWRKMEARFIDENVDRDPAARAKMRIICTPGIKCYLEMKHILSLGFKPENVLAVERDRAAWSEFSQNAHALGIQPVYGELYEVLAAQRQRFDIALVDFVGQHSVPSIEVLYNLPLADKAVVALTILAKRENKIMQEVMAQVHRDHEGKLRSEALKNAIGKLDDKMIDDLTEINLHEMWRQEEEQLENAETGDVSHEIRDTVMWHTIKQLGGQRTDMNIMGKLIENTRLPLEEMKQLADSGKNRGLSLGHIRMAAFSHAIDYVHRITADLQSIWLFHYMQRSKKKSIASLKSIGNAALVNERQISKLEKYYYKSKVGQKGASPFLTNLAVVESSTENFKKIMPAIHFNFIAARAVLGDAKDSLNGKTDSHYSAFLEGMDLGQMTSGRFNRDTKLVFLKGEKRITSLAIRELLNNLDVFEAFNDKFPLSDYQEQKKVARIDLGELA